MLSATAATHSRGPVRAVGARIHTNTVLPALDLLDHAVTWLPAELAAYSSISAHSLVLVDATGDLAAARALTTVISGIDDPPAVIAVLNEGGFSALGASWPVVDVLHSGASVAEVEARIRLALSRHASLGARGSIRATGLEIDEANYSISMNNKPLDLTYKEFELLRFLALHPARVFSREQLLSEVWGCDYYGGTRTVDVHVRRLRAKLGDLDALIGTVRNVGYRFWAEPVSRATTPPASNRPSGSDRPPAVNRPPAASRQIGA